MEIKLEFYVVWNYTPRAVGTIEDVLEIYGNKVTNIQLIPSGGGVFEFHLNEKLIFSKKELGRHSEDGEILIKGENVMLGYWNLKEETEKVPWLTWSQ